MLPSRSNQTTTGIRSVVTLTGLKLKEHPVKKIDLKCCKFSAQVVDWLREHDTGAGGPLLHVTLPHLPFPVCPLSHKGVYA